LEEHLRVLRHDLWQWRKQVLLQAQEAEADVRFHLLQKKQQKQTTQS
jgi:hypothetical protein